MARESCQDTTATGGQQPRQCIVRRGHVVVEGGGVTFIGRGWLRGWLVVVGRGGAVGVELEQF